MEYEIKPVDGHYEVYIDGEFYCTADTYSEAEKEVDEYYKWETGMKKAVKKLVNRLYGTKKEN